VQAWAKKGDVGVPNMTKKESTYLRKLELENALLSEQHAKHMRVFGEQIIELIDLRAKLQLLNEILNDKPE
jgi:hypothetical protein